MFKPRYTLQAYKGMGTRHRCPGCNASKTFVLYIDTQTHQPLHPSVGRCNRQSKCGYHFKPKQYFENNPGAKTHTPVFKPVKQAPVPPASFIDPQTFEASLTDYQHNNFISYLMALFGLDITDSLIERYAIGSHNHWPGATVFWQIDPEGNLRTGKIMLYNRHTGKRVKLPYNHITWMHTVLKLPSFNLKQCLFGEHLLHDTGKGVAIVESEKTAIIASVYFPHMIWVAAGSLTNLNAKTCAALKGRHVTLYPDLNGYQRWTEKAAELERICATVTICDILEHNAPDTDLQQGFDLADYLIKFDHRYFITQRQQPARQPTPAPEPEPEPSANWLPEIQELEDFFNRTPLPASPFKPNRYTTLHNVAHAIAVDLASAKRHNGNWWFDSSMRRLRELRRVMEGM